MEGIKKEALRRILEKLKGNNSREWLSKELGVSIYAVRSWILGNTVPDTENLTAIANYMGINTADLVQQIEGIPRKKTFPTTAEEGYSMIQNLPRPELIQLIKYILDDLEKD